MVTVGVGGARFGTRPLSAEALAAASVPYASKSTAADAIHCMVRSAQDMQSQQMHPQIGTWYY
jgi:hypothetical protein